jgi:hypothetical protein
MLDLNISEATISSRDEMANEGGQTVDEMEIEGSVEYRPEGVFLTGNPKSLTFEEDEDAE